MKSTRALSVSIRRIALCLAGAFSVLCATASANDLSAGVVGAWRLVSHTVTVVGETFDAHAALLAQRPCAAAIRYRIGADGTYRLDASGSDCDEKYMATQEKLYAKTKWKLEGTTFTTSSTNFAVGQSYTVSIAGNRMTWVGTEGQGTLVFER